MVRLFLIYLLLLPTFAWPQTQPVNKTVLYTLTEKDGLTDNAVNCFFQDSRGVMWMGTNYGLNSFDGSVIKNFHITDNNGLSNDAINDIKEDDKGNLWIATGYGLCSYNLVGKKFTSYFCENKEEVPNRFYSLAINGSTILLGTEKGLVIFNTKSASFSFISNSDAAASRITKVFIDHKKRTWLCTYDGVWLFDISSKTLTQYDSQANDKLFNGLVTDMFEDNNGRLWFGTWSSGLKQLLPEIKSVETYLHYSNSNSNIVSITEQKNQVGQYELISGSVLTTISFEKKSFLQLINTGSANPFYTSRVYTDRNNLLWISTIDGVKIYNPSKQYFRTISLSSSIPITSQGPCLYPLQGRFLLGGEGSTALQLFSDSLHLLKNLSSQVRQGAAVMNIQQDGQKNYWLCTSNGLIVLDEQLREQKIFLHDDKDPASLPKNFLNNLLFKKNGEIWIMPWRKGIWKLSNEGRFSYVITNKGDSLLPGANISKSTEDINGNIWITDYTGGLYKYSPASGKIENIIPNARLSNEYLAGNKLWTVSSQAVYSIDINNNQQEVYPLPPGKDKYEYDFIPDDNVRLWIATKTGLLSFNMQTKIFQQYSTADGLFTDVLDVSMAKLSNGYILMAGGTFATLFNPAMADEKSGQFPLLFTGASFDNNEKTINNNTAVFSWDEKNIHLSWALLNYCNPLGNIYYYKLDGVNKTWQIAGNKGEVYFNSLDPGKYVFHYKAATSQGEMSNEQTITLIIHPPFWKTWWFIAAVVLLLSFLFYKVVRYISQRNLKEKLLRLEKEQAIEKERNRISRDMHDDLGSGLTKIAILSEVVKKQMNEPDKARQQLESISQSSRELVDNLQDIIWVLNPKNDTLESLAAYIREYALKFFEPFGINLLFQYPDKFPDIRLSEETRRNIFLVVKETLNNTAKHAWCNRVTIVLASGGSSVSLTITDDGKGFDIEKTRMFGNGLLNMQHRIQQVGGSYTIQSEPDKGTTTKIDITV